MLRRFLVLVPAFACAACVQAASEIALDGGTSSDAGLPADVSTVAAVDAVDRDTGLVDPVPGDAPVVRIVEPADGAEVLDERVRIRGTATDDRGVARVFVRSGPNVALPAQSTDGFRTWWADVPAGVGTFEVVATGWDVDGASSDAEDRILLTRPTLTDTRPPTVVIDEPDDGAEPLQATVLLRGQANDDAGVVAMQTWVDGVLRNERPVETADGFATWARLVTLDPGVTSTIRIVAVDGAGREGEASVTLTGRATLDREPPTVQIDSPRDGEDPGVGIVRVTGRASDDSGVREVRVRVHASDATSAWVDATTTDGWRSFAADVPIDPGPATIEARAVDAAGLAASVMVDIENGFVPEWSAERVVFLRLRPDTAPPDVTMVLDRDGIPEVMTEDVQRSIVLLEADTTGLLRNTLDAVKNACGERWRDDNPNPRHDCDLTALGRTFVGADGSWQSSPEYAMVRLLTMTPANVEVAGTSIAGLQELADGGFFGITIGGGFSQILAEALGIARTDEIVPTGPAMEALRTNVLAPHPATTDEGYMPITLFDALRDLAPMAERFGPSGEHPGVLVPGSTTRAEVLDDDFAMTLVATSNLRWFDGIDLGAGKEYLALIDDETGPGFNDVLEFDFTDPDRFEFAGIVEEPRGDLRFQILENDGFIASCNGDDACRRNLPDAPLSGTSIWAAPPWELEPVFARASFNAYRDRVFERCYINFLGCQASVTIGTGGTPRGWATFDVLFDLGDPPRDQYVWELITEIAQVALHDVEGRTIPEGDADVAFEMRDLDVGLRADELRDAMRPFLQSQAGEISRLLLGDYRRTNGAVDLFYRLGDDGRPYLFFVAPDDPRPIDDYAYAAVGFFASPALTDDERVSRTAIPGSGDNDHHKLRLEPGQTTVYAGDDEGGVYRIVLDVPDGPAPEVVARIARRLR